MKRYEIMANSSYNPVEDWPSFASEIPHAEVESGIESVTIDVDDEYADACEQYLDKATWCESYSEVVKFQIVSYAKAKLELYDRQVEFEADALEEVEREIAGSELLQDQMDGQTERVYRVERTDGQEVY
ncbi:MAG TPA: hypothetical protein VGC91_07900 [Pyrinomonadaceae bacterium]|jgi:hypothetical protein